MQEARSRSGLCRLLWAGAAFGKGAGLGPSSAEHARDWSKPEKSAICDWVLPKAAPRAEAAQEASKGCDGAASAPEERPTWWRCEVHGDGPEDDLSFEFQKETRTP